MLGVEGSGREVLQGAFNGVATAIQRAELERQALIKAQKDLDEKVRQGYKNPGNEGRRKAAMPEESTDDSEKANAGIFTKEKRMPPSPREMASGGKVSSASKRADGCATKGKTRGKFV
jgi:hypothetical protein